MEANVAVKAVNIDYGQFLVVKIIGEEHGPEERAWVESAFPVLQELYSKLPKEYQKLFETPSELSPQKFIKLLNQASEYANEKQMGILGFATSHFSRYNLWKYR